MIGLDKKKIIAAKVLGVGKERIIFDSSKLAEIKEAITKQDIRDLYAEGLIKIKEKKGIKKKEKRKTKRGPGKIKKKVKYRKKDYMNLIRKLRKYISGLKNQKKISKEKYQELRKKIKAKEFKDLAHLKEYLGGKIK